MTKMTKVFNALCPPGRAYAMQAIAVKMFRDSTTYLFDGLYDFISAIHKDLGSADGNEMREDAIKNWEDQFGLAPSPSDTLQQRRDAIEALGRIGPEAKSALRPLIQVLNDGEEWVPGDTVWALRKITGQDFGTDQTKWLHWYKQAYGEPIKKLMTDSS